MRVVDQVGLDSRVSHQRVRLDHRHLAHVARVVGNATAAARCCRAHRVLPRLCQRSHQARGQARRRRRACDQTRARHGTKRRRVDLFDPVHNHRLVRVDQVVAVCRQLGRQLRTDHQQLLLDRLLRLGVVEEDLDLVHHKSAHCARCGVAHERRCQVVATHALSRKQLGVAATLLAGAFAHPRGRLELPRRRQPACKRRDAASCGVFAHRAASALLPSEAERRFHRSIRRHCLY
mmetsp:Transcript_40349/g.120353  ORF Transcript_40349/g.120353 Transcript_40349/m.120353 type:complete len:234 (+) Transcript_40349:1590-2291(+)